MSTTIKLEKVRVSYAHLWKPRQVKGSDSPPAYSVSLIVPKNHPQVAEIKAAIKAEVELKWPDPKKRPSKLHNPLRDGDTEREGDDAYANSYFINARTAIEYPPLVYDGQRQPVTDSSYWGSGDYANVGFDFYGFDMGANRGVGVGLRQVQFLKKGEPLGYRNNAPMFEVQEGETESMFD